MIRFDCYWLVTVEEVEATMRVCWYCPLTGTRSEPCAPVARQLISITRQQIDETALCDASTTDTITAFEHPPMRSRRQRKSQCRMDELAAGRSVIGTARRWCAMASKAALLTFDLKIVDGFRLHSVLRMSRKCVIPRCYVYH